jgi:dihydrodipicolinate reductase
LIKKGFENDIIIETTGLSNEQIEKLRKMKDLELKTN